MELRNIGERKRNLKYDCSFHNPLFLQMNAAVKEVRQFFDSIPNNGLKIFDFGCGSKPYKSFCGENSYIGIDIDKKNINADIFCDVHEVPVDEFTADIVCSFYMLEHVYTPTDVLKEKFRILKPGGKMFMLVPLYWEEHEQPYDFWRYTQYSLKKMLEDVGYENIKIKPINAGWAILGMNFVRTLHSRRYMRFMIPCFNYLFFSLDQRSLRLGSATNVMSYAVFGEKGK